MNNQKLRFLLKNADIGRPTKKTQKQQHKNEIKSKAENSKKAKRKETPKIVNTE